MSKLPKPLDIAVWGKEAKCKTLIDPDTGEIASAAVRVSWFYPNDRGMRPNPIAVKACTTCPVLRECAEWAIWYEDEGYMGGMTPKERDIIRRKRGIFLRKDTLAPRAKPVRHRGKDYAPVECGTFRKYSQHMRLGQTVELKINGGCGCLEAWVAEMDRRREARAERTRINKRKWYARQREAKREAQTEG